ncbi:MAG: cupin domain-containing protein [Desulfovibrionaceae bacterium]|nr:cupin domain-containing protein [Desulfovibrionaceae bacterium]
MKKFAACALSLSLLAPLCLSQNAAAAEQDAAADAHQVVLKAGSQPSRKAGPKNFTGSVRVDPLFRAEAPVRTYATSVTFEPGARTFWHVHPTGQRLIVTAGVGLTQEWGGPVQVIRAGDVVVCPPDVKHWHGASASTSVTHIAISEYVKDMGARWMEEVSEEQYAKAPALTD